jgi:hypothetical protein
LHKDNCGVKEEEEQETIAAQAQFAMFACKLSAYISTQMMLGISQSAKSQNATGQVRASAAVPRTRHFATPAIIGPKG